ncbi:MAG: PTS sugar transporter subunit IIA [Endomicrobiia bacterium]
MINNIGFIIITHGLLAEGFKKALFSIVGEKEKIVSIPITSEFTLEYLCNLLKQEIEKLNCDYVIVFTDMLGGTPCNASLRICKDFSNVYIISGVNLYMLIYASNLREQQEIKDINEYVEKIISEGKKNISNVKEVFNKKIVK